MFVGTLLLAVALIALALAFVLSLRDLVRGHDADPTRTVRSTWLATVVLVFVLVLLAGAFIVGQLDIAYVWRNIDLRYAWYQRLSGLWVGREGSLLLWTTFGLTFWSLEELRHHRALGRSEGAAVAAATTAHDHGPRDETPTALRDTEQIRRVARTVVLGVLLSLLAVVALYRPFTPTGAAELAASPMGRGVNPQLIIAFNAIHPPILFTGYALTLPVAAFGLAHLVTGAPAWIGPARRWAHLAFLFLTLGVGLGGLWAYIALGWGGYWAWDPVEVGSIVPWIAVTTFLHAAYRHDGHGDFPVAAPVLAFLAFPATLLSTFIVRAGGVWVSVHSFLGPGAADSAWERYRTALSTQYEVQLYSALLVAAAAALVVFTMRHVRRIDAATAPAAPPAADKAPSRDATTPAAAGLAATLDRIESRLTLRNLFVVGVLLLALLGTVTVTVLFLGVNGFPSDAARERVFTERTGPIALSAVLVMAVAISIGVLRRRQVLGLLAGALLLGVAASQWWPQHRALVVAVPLLACAAVIAGARIVAAWRRMPRRPALRFTGIHLVHLGVAAVFLGHGFVSTFEQFHEPVALTVGESRDVGPYLVRLDALTTRDTDDNGRIDEVTATLSVWEGGRYLGAVDSGYRYYDFMVHYKPTVGVGRHWDRDVYLAPAGLHDPTQGWLFGNLPLVEQNAFEARAVDAYSVQVATIPYINLVWGGAALMVMGAALLSWSSWTTGRPRTAPHTTTRAVPA